MSETGKKVEVRYGAFACSIEGYDNPVEQMREILGLMQQMISETPQLAEQAGNFDASEVEDALAPNRNASPGVVVIRNSESDPATGSIAVKDEAISPDSAEDVSDIDASDAEEPDILVVGRPSDAMDTIDSDLVPEDETDQSAESDLTANDAETVLPVEATSLADLPDENDALDLSGIDDAPAVATDAEAGEKVDAPIDGDVTGGEHEEIAVAAFTAGSASDAGAENLRDAISAAVSAPADTPEAIDVAAGIDSADIAVALDAGDVESSAQFAGDVAEAAQESPADPASGLSDLALDVPDFTAPEIDTADVAAQVSTFEAEPAFTTEPKTADPALDTPEAAPDQPVADAEQDAHDDATAADRDVNSWRDRIAGFVTPDGDDEQEEMAAAPISADEDTAPRRSAIAPGIAEQIAGIQSAADAALENAGSAATAEASSWSESIAGQAEAFSEPDLSADAVSDAVTADDTTANSMHDHAAPGEVDLAVAMEASPEAGADESATDWGTAVADAEEASTETPEIENPQLDADRADSPVEEAFNIFAAPAASRAAVATVSANIFAAPQTPETSRPAEVAAAKESSSAAVINIFGAPVEPTPEPEPTREPADFAEGIETIEAAAGFESPAIETQYETAPMDAEIVEDLPRTEIVRGEIISTGDVLPADAEINRAIEEPHEDPAPFNMFAAPQPQDASPAQRGFEGGFASDGVPSEPTVINATPASDDGAATERPPWERPDGPMPDYSASARARAGLDPAPTAPTTPTPPTPPAEKSFEVPPQNAPISSESQSRFQEMLQRVQPQDDDVLADDISGTITNNMQAARVEISASELAERSASENTSDLLAASAAWLTLVKSTPRFTRREVMQVFDTIPGDHPKTLEARIKGYGKLVRNGTLMLVDDGVFAMSDSESDRFHTLINQA